MGELGLVYDVVIRLIPRQGPLVGYRIVLWGHFKYLVLDIGWRGSAIALQASFAIGRDAGLQLRGGMPRGVRMLSCLFQTGVWAVCHTQSFSAARGAAITTTSVYRYCIRRPIPLSAFATLLLYPRRGLLSRGAQLRWSFGTRSHVDH